MSLYRVAGQKLLVRAFAGSQPDAPCSQSPRSCSPAGTAGWPCMLDAPAHAPPSERPLLACYVYCLQHSSSGVVFSACQQVGGHLCSLPFLQPAALVNMPACPDAAEVAASSSPRCLLLWHASLDPEFRLYWQSKCRCCRNPGMLPVCLSTRLLLVSFWNDSQDLLEGARQALQPAGCKDHGHTCGCSAPACGQLQGHGLHRSPAAQILGGCMSPAPSTQPPGAAWNDGCAWTEHWPKSGHQWRAG